MKKIMSKDLTHGDIFQPEGDNRIMTLVKVGGDHRTVSFSAGTTFGIDPRAGYYGKEVTLITSLNILGDIIEGLV